MTRTDCRPEGWPISRLSGGMILAYCGVELVEQAPQMPGGQDCCVCGREVPVGRRAYVWQDRGGAIGHEDCLDGALTW
jgi:hypothetical protein